MKKKEERLTIPWWFFRDNWCRESLTKLGGSAKFCGYYIMSDKPCRKSNCLEWKALKKENKEYGKK